MLIIENRLLQAKTSTPFYQAHYGGTLLKKKHVLRYTVLFFFRTDTTDPGCSPFLLSGFVSVPCGRLSWFLRAFDRTLISHCYLLTYIPSYSYTKSTLRLRQFANRDKAVVDSGLRPRCTTHNYEYFRSLLFSRIWLESRLFCLSCSVTRMWKHDVSYNNVTRRRQRMTEPRAQATCKFLQHFYFILFYTCRLRIACVRYHYGQCQYAVVQ